MMVKAFFPSIVFLWFSTAGLVLAQVNAFNLANPQADNCGTIQVAGGFSIEGGNQGTAVDWDWGDGCIGRSFFPAKHHFRQDGAYTITARLVRGNQILATRTVPVSVRIDSSCGSFTKAGPSVQEIAKIKNTEVREFLKPLRTEFENSVLKIEMEKAGEAETATIQYIKTLDSILGRCMDERRLEDAVAVKEEIDRVRDSLPVTPESLREGLVLHYTFDRAEPDEAVTDHSEMGNHGRAADAHWTAAGQRGGGFEFNAMNSYITVPDADSLHSRNLTLAAWIKTGSKDRYWRRIFDKYLPDGFALTMSGQYNNSGSREGQAVWIMSETGQLHYSQSGVQVADGRWHHVAATFDGQVQQVYVDGMPAGAPFRWNNPGSTARNSYDLTLGLNRSNPDENSVSFAGTMDDVMVFNRALSAKEILGLFEFQATAPVSPMPDFKESPAPTRDSGTYSRQVTFRSSEKAPAGFSQWSFLYHNPSFDPDAKLEVVFLQPDGKELLKYSGYSKSGEKPGTIHRPYFGLGISRTDPSIFYNHAINVVFRVSKGDLAIDPREKYSFSFYMGNMPSMEERAAAAKSASTTQPYRFIGGESYLPTLAKEQVVFIVPTHETDKSAEKEINAYVKMLCDKLQNNAIVLSDEQALRMNLSDNGVIAYGTPTGNLWLAKYLALLPVRIEQNRIVAGLEHTGTDLRFMGAWPNPQNPQKGLFVFTAQQAKDIVGIDEVYRKVMADFVVARGTDLLDADTYSKPDGGWQLPIIVEAVMEIR